MIRSRALLCQLCDDPRGMTIVEFAIILPVLMLLLLGTFELGYRMYVTSIVQGALHEAARLATIGNQSTTQIDARVKGRLYEFSRNAVITTNVSSYSDYTHVGTPEVITSDTAPVGSYNTGDCYEDYNNNQRYDLDRGRSGLGQADDIVRYEVSMVYPQMFPVGGFLGWTNNNQILANTVLRNQPYAGRSTPTPAVRCS